ncbi:hypothetical protein Nit79A3_2435 [Nitrosomonas sp. Is79A3]|uniref:hypothetical protein n=1 Tax=Nitrosomonas sp. (strain Is79A3) TaxID=261292 RepID=UPI000215CAE2
MKNAILIELAKIWTSQAETPEIQDGSEDAKLRNARDKGARETKRECADTLRMLVNTFKE